MDLLAALALVMVLEGLAVAIMARSIPELLAEIQHLGGGRLRRLGIAVAAVGAILYVLIRGGGA